MELKRAKTIRSIEAKAIRLRDPRDLVESESQLTPQERWDAAITRITPYFEERYDPGRKDTVPTIKNELSTNVVEVSPARQKSPATYLQISSHPVGPYLRATWSFGEFPEGFGHLPGVKPHLDPIVESFSPALINDGFDEKLALGLLTAVEQSVEVFCNAKQAEKL
ncbi:MAG TPA: hypothetical protein PKB09_02250 [Candidatus Saccharibacteria bacterium]|nr:hypothetical protein [Candidatus Saccharibacteria bacterium]